MQIFQSQKTFGVLLVTFSALAFSTAGLFVKGVEAGSWEIIFWRGIFAGGFSMCFVVMRGAFTRECRNMGYSGIAVACLSALGTSAFIPAFKLTTIANVTLIYAACPMVAAFLAWICIKERVSKRMMLAVLAGFGGVGIIVSGTSAGVHFLGDMLALVMTLALAAMMVVYRAFPGTPASGPMILSSALLLVPATVLGAGAFSVLFEEIVILAGFGLIFTVGSITLAEGARRISATQTAMLSVLETPLALLLAWVFLAERAAGTTILGGVVVFAAVIIAQVGTNR